MAKGKGSRKTHADNVELMAIVLKFAEKGGKSICKYALPKDELISNATLYEKRITRSGPFLCGLRSIQSNLSFTEKAVTKA